jgi:hypothetical protein
MKQILGSDIRAMVPRDKLGPEMGLKPAQVIILAHTAGKTPEAQ